MSPGDPALAPVSLAGRLVRIAGGPVAGARPLWAGAMHYFRAEPRHWGRCLRGLRELGFTFVDTAVPWGVHEQTAGRLDFGGARDLGAFLDACAGEGLAVLLRVGPLVGGELLYGGLPERIVDNPALAARSGRGTPVAVIEPPRGWPLPSYGCRAFLDEVGGFYRALGEVVGPRLCPLGAVAIVHVDHEQGGFYRAGAFDSDYHPEVLARFAEEHGGAAPPTGWPRPLPATPEALRPILSWLAFRERRINATLAALGARLDEAGIARATPGGGPGALRMHGFSPLPPLAYDQPAAEEVVDLAALHLIGRRGDYAMVRERVRTLAGGSRFPVASPLALGGFPWGPAVDAGGAVTTLLTALMHGAVGYAGGMAVGRDRWIGGALDERGEPQPALAAPLARLHRALVEADFPSLRTPAPLGLLVPRGYRQLQLAASHLGPLAPLSQVLGLERAGALDENLGLSVPVQTELPALVRRLVAAAGAARVPLVLIEGLPDRARLRELPALLLPCLDFLDAELVARLADHAAAGGRLLWGPRTPHLDGALAAASVALPGERFEAGLLDDPPALAARLLALAAPAAGQAQASARPANPLVDAVVHARADGNPALLFVASALDKPWRARIDLAAGGSFVDVLTGDRFAAEAGGASSPSPSIELPLSPGAVRLLAAAS